RPRQGRSALRVRGQSRPVSSEDAAEGPGIGPRRGARPANWLPACPPRRPAVRGRPRRQTRGTDRRQGQPGRWETAGLRTVDQGDDPELPGGPGGGERTAPLSQGRRMGGRRQGGVGQGEEPAGPERLPAEDSGSLVSGKSPEVKKAIPRVQAVGV